VLIKISTFQLEDGCLKCSE